jgi:hypothetical protein
VAVQLKMAPNVTSTETIAVTVENAKYTNIV